MEIPINAGEFSMTLSKLESVSEEDILTAMGVIQATPGSQAVLQYLGEVLKYRRDIERANKVDREVAEVIRSTLPQQITSSQAYRIAVALRTAGYIKLDRTPPAVAPPVAPPPPVSKAKEVDPEPEKNRYIGSQGRKRTDPLFSPARRAAEDVCKVLFPNGGATKDRAFPAIVKMCDDIRSGDKGWGGTKEELAYKAVRFIKTENHVLIEAIFAELLAAKAIRNGTPPQCTEDCPKDCSQLLGH